MQFFLIVILTIFPLGTLAPTAPGKSAPMYIHTGGRHGDCAADDFVDARTRHRLQQTVHAARHQHHDQEAGEAEAGCVLVHGPARREGLAVDHVLVLGGQLCPVPRQSVQLQRVADRGQPARADFLQRLHDPQQSLVLAGRLHAPWLRRLSAVSGETFKL